MNKLALYLFIIGCIFILSGTIQLLKARHHCVAISYRWDRHWYPTFQVYHGEGFASVWLDDGKVHLMHNMHEWLERNK